MRHLVIEQTFSFELLKILKYNFINFSKLIGAKYISKTLLFYNFISKIYYVIINPIQKVCPHYQIICFYSINTCCDIFVSYEFFNFFLNVFKTKIIKTCHIFTNDSKNYPVSPYSSVIITIYYVCPILYFK